MFPIVIACVAVLWAIILVVCIKEPTLPKITSLILKSIVLTLYLVVWMLGKWYRKHMVYLILSMYLINTFLNVVVTQVTYSVAEIQVMEDKDFRNDQTVDLFLCCLFLSPSGTFTLIYNVVYFISVIWATYTWREYDDKNFAQSRL